MKHILLPILLLSSLFSQIWINEIDYDQPGSDVGEFLEVAGPAGTYSNVSLELINGNNGSVYNTVYIGTLTLEDQSNGFGFHAEYISGIQNGAPDGAQLLIGTTIVDAVAYEGSLNDTDGNPMEEAGEDYQSTDEEAQSISRAGLDGSPWEEVSITPGAINTNQGINADGNLSPYANAGSDQYVQPGTTVTLDGSASIDSDGVIVSYLWEQSSGPDVELSSDDEMIITFNFPQITETTNLVFELTVTDDAGASNTDEVSVSYTYYEQITIAEAREAGEGVEIMISGIITSPNFQSSGSEFTIQDETAGIVLYGSGITDLDLNLGDEVMVSGVTDEYNGKFEIIISSSLDVQVVQSGAILPQPQIITVSELYNNGELYESELITIENVTTEDEWPADGWSENLTISDGGSFTTTMRIDSDTEIDGSQEPTWPVSVTGVGGQYDSSDPYTEGYQLLPRYITDFEGIEGMPVASAGLDQSVQPGDVVTLDGSESYDTNDDGSIIAYEWVQIGGDAVVLDNAENATTFFTAPDGNDIIRFRLTIWDNEINEATDEVSITVTTSGPSTISEIIHNCGDEMGESLTCDGQYNLSGESAAECPLYETSVTTTGTIVDYFDITPFNGPHSFTIEDANGNQIDFVVWPESSQYQDGFDITTTALNVLTQEPFGTYEVEITGELGAYCDDDELLDINSEWQVTVEYESDITINTSNECIADGDVNGDEGLNILDVVQTVSYVLGNLDFTDSQICSSDLNEDGEINILDIVQIVNLILQG